MPLLVTRGLTVRYPGVKPLKMPDLTVEPGQVTELNGASGTGKSTFALRALGLLPAGSETHGELTMTGRLGWIPQDVANAFSPFQRMAIQICDGAQHHLRLSFAEAMRVAASMLEQLAVDPERLYEHPHRWSGGMLQRALVVMALVAEPRVVIADEPTASLDERSAARVLKLLEDYASRGNGVVLIRHSKPTR